ncbi:MAG: hypothetical protein KC470_14240, partial [Dehalococcoidia bacterium]|nr:hypothetical protein [Dehalococcoidia bacterium]
SDQHAVWGDIAGKAARLQSESASGAMAAMYERHRTRLEDYIQAFPVVDRQCGAVFSIRGAVTGIEMFDFPSIAGKLLPKLIQSYALDAIDEAEGAQARGLTIDGFLGLLSSTAMRSYPSVGEGDDLRYAAGAVAGGALAARGRVVHLSAFATQTAAALGEPRKAAGMASASVRRRNRSGRAGA